jgi:hypothetical protein
MNMQKWLKAGIAGLVTLLAVQGNGAPPAGAYHGTVSRYTMFDGKPRLTVCGTFSLNTTARGRTTAKVVLREQTLSFKAGGWEDAEGTPSVRMESRGGETLVLAPFGSIEYMVGTLSGGSLGDEKMFIAATYHAFADQTDAAAQAELARLQGYYTVALVCWDVLPRGDAEEEPWGNGYLTMTVGGGGKVKIAGVLADGTKVSQASTLTTTPGVPFFRPLYRRRGEIGGLLKIDPDTRDVKVDWSQPAVYWDKLGSGPDGFQARLVPLGGYFIKGAPLPGPIGSLVANGNKVAYHLPGGPVMPQPVMPYGVPVTLAGTRPVVEKGVKPVLSGDGTHYVYTGNNSALATLRYSPLTGIFRGSFNQYYDYGSGGRLVHKVVKVPFAGVMLQWNGKVENGFGHYLVPETNPAFGALRIKRSFWIDLIYYYD